MKRWFETQGYVAVWWLALRQGPLARWLHDTWSSFFFRRYCPYPTLKDNWTARACVESGCCGCNNQDRCTIPPAYRVTP